MGTFERLGNSGAVALGEPALPSVWHGLIPAGSAVNGAGSVSFGGDVIVTIYGLQLINGSFVGTATSMQAWTPGNAVLIATFADINVSIDINSIGPLLGALFSGDDLVVGFDYGEELGSGSGSDTVEGKGGNDRLFGGSGSDTVYGGDGNDVIFGDNFQEAPADQIGDGDDVIHGGNGADLIRGGAGNDEIHGGAGLDILEGEGGDDLFVFNSGELFSEGSSGESYNGGAGFDTLEFRGGGFFEPGVTPLISIEAIKSDTSDTTLTLANETLALLVADMAGAADKLVINAWTGGGYDVATLFALLDGGRGIERVEWTQSIHTHAAVLDPFGSGRIHVTATDITDVRPYNNITNSFEADGDLRQQTRIDDDGAFTTINYDANGVITDLTIDAFAAPGRGYTSLQNSYTDGKLASSTLELTNGVTSEKTFDTSGPASVLQSYTRTDVLDAYAWSTIEETYDASGVLTRRLTTNDAEAAIASIEMNHAGGVLTDRLITYADGRTSETTFAGGNTVVLTRNTATNGDQTVIGGAGDDTITGGTGNDLLIGGPGNDVFTFSGTFGNDRISGFANGQEQLDLTAYNVFVEDDIAGNGFTATQIGRNTVIDLGANGTITLMSFDIANLDDGDFAGGPV